jgi:hypothetical protein
VKIGLQYIGVGIRYGTHKPGVWLVGVSNHHTDRKEANGRGMAVFVLATAHRQLRHLTTSDLRLLYAHVMSRRQVCTGYYGILTPLPVIDSSLNLNPHPCASSVR